jgi:hypothetical protein
MSRWYSKRKKLNYTKIIKKWVVLDFCGGKYNDGQTPVCGRKHGQCYGCYSEQFE